MIEDHQLFSEAVAPLLTEQGWVALEPAPNAAAGLEAAKDKRPDIVLVDVVLPDMDGIELGAEILRMLPGTKVLALTAVTQPRAIRQAFDSGFHGYLTKDLPFPKLVQIIRGVLEGQIILPQALDLVSAEGRSAEEQHADIVGSQLTPREYEVLELLVKGTSTREMARRLSISPNTIRTHIQNVLEKLQVGSRLQAAAFAVRHRLVIPYLRANDG